MVANPNGLQAPLPTDEIGALSTAVHGASTS
jgi:hypothetical protein